jgi:hypothetical protein
MGVQLGFRNVGNDTSVFGFSSVIKNSDPYENENVTVISGINYVSDPSGNLILLKNNSIKLNGYEYIMMVIEEFSNVITINNSKVTKYFAKINMPSVSATSFKYTELMLYDTFVNVSSVLYNPIDLSKLTVSFYAPDGTLFDFCGVDHSFVLEVTSINYIPDETGIDSTNSQF